MRNSLLIIDDSEDTRELFSVTLRFEGFEVQTAKSGCEALDLLRDHNDFSLILLDLRMPDMDGFEFLKRLKSEGLAVDTPILLVSAAEGVDKMELPENVAGALKKPFFYPELIHKIKELHTRSGEAPSGLLNRLF